MTFTSAPEFVPTAAQSQTAQTTDKPATATLNWERQSKPDFNQFRVKNKELDTFEIKPVEQIQETKEIQPVQPKPTKTQEPKPIKAQESKPTKAQETHETFFSELAGDEPVKPFLDIYAELKNKAKAPAKMDEILKKLTDLVGKCKITPEEKEKNVIYLLFDPELIPKRVYKSLKDANPTFVDFQKSKQSRQQMG